MPTITFQSTPPRGRRHFPCSGESGGQGFQSTPPRGRRRSCRRIMSSLRRFQSTPPRGRRLSGWTSFLLINKFQSTPPRGRRPAKSASVADACGGFNPRLRVGGDVRTGRTPPRGSGFNPRLRVGGDRIQPQQPWPGRVSIHASAWEATYEEKTISRVPVNVSIHASAWEATAECRAPNGGPGGFNPRLRVGGDISLPWKFPARQSFNPRLRVGGDPFQADRMATDAGFQSTPPRGRRLCVFLCLVLVGTGFNPRLRVGGDGIRSCILI